MTVQRKHIYWVKNIYRVNNMYMVHDKAFDKIMTTGIYTVKSIYKENYISS